jgi:tetratricopeptide (TPR) repeat protein
MTSYNIAAIRDLTKAAFTDKTLRQFCQIRPEFRPFLDRVSSTASLDDMAYDLIEYCRKANLLPALLSGIEEDNPRQYARYRERLYKGPGEPSQVPAGPFIVPFARNERFVGRETELAELHRLLQAEGRPTGITPAGISGMGGIGKTQLAVEYAYRYRDAYPGGVFWINATRVEDWSRELVDLADQIGLAPADPSSPDRTGQMVAAFSRHLKEQPDALLVFDNVADPHHLKTEQLGAGLTADRLGGTLLFTTRRRDMPKGLTSLDIQVLPSDMAQQMILAARPGAVGERGLDELCAALGNLPLGLEMAAAALRNRPKLSLPAYLKHLQELGADVVHEKARVTPDDLATYYATSLIPALQAQWNGLKRVGARLLLRAAAELGEADLIPVVWLGMLTGLRDDRAGLDEPLSDAVRELEMASLLEPVTGARIRLHPLVHEFAVQLTTDSERESFHLELATNVENTLATAPWCREWAITAGECLLDLVWGGEPAVKLRYAALDALRALMCDDDVPVPERRAAALLLTRLDWWMEFPDIPTGEMLIYLRLFSRYLDFSADRLGLIQTISRVLQSDSVSRRQQAQLLFHRAAMQGQQGEFSGDESFLDAGAKDYEAASDIVRDLISSEARQPEDHRLVAQIGLGAGHIAVIRAEALTSLEEQNYQREHLHQAVASYRAAAESAEIYERDVFLKANIYQELSYACALLQNWAESEEYYAEALKILQEGRGAVKDVQAYASLYALILEVAAYTRWLKGQILALPEYEAAYKLAEQEIDILQETLHPSEGLFEAHINAGEYLVAMHECPGCSVSQPLEKACEHWRTAQDIARSLRIIELEQEAEDRLRRYC